MSDGELFSSTKEAASLQGLILLLEGCQNVCSQSKDTVMAAVSWN